MLPFQADIHVPLGPRRDLPLYDRDMRRPAAPIAADPAAGHHVHVKVRRILTGDNSVVLD